MNRQAIKKAPEGASDVLRLLITAHPTPTSGLQAVYHMEQTIEMRRVR